MINTAYHDIFKRDDRAKCKTEPERGPKQPLFMHTREPEETHPKIFFYPALELKRTRLKDTFYTSPTRNPVFNQRSKGHARPDTSVTLQTHFIHRSPEGPI